MAIFDRISKYLGIAMIASAMLILSAQSAVAAPRVTTVAELEAPLYYGDYFWDEAGAPKGAHRKAAPRLSSIWKKSSSMCIAAVLKSPVL